MSIKLHPFYVDTLNRLLRDGELRRDMRILLVCGGPVDREAFMAAGFTDVTISNLDDRLTTDADRFAPYQWGYQDAEKLTYEDNSFDVTVVHWGLHHCVSPHGALLEMNRVARHGVLVFEPYDSFLSRLGVRLGFGQEYELAAIVLNKYQYGGVRNSIIPNYVHRWNRWEMIRTIRTGDPTRPYRFRFLHELRIPWMALKGRKNPLFFWSVVLASPFLKLLGWIFPTQGNHFAAWIRPEDKLQPWLEEGDVGARLNLEYFQARYSDDKWPAPPQAFDNSSEE